MSTPGLARNPWSGRGETTAAWTVSLVAIGAVAEFGCVCGQHSWWASQVRTGERPNGPAGLSVWGQ